jgi:hypothetical protein
MPSATAPLGLVAREGGGGGAPSQKTCRSPSIPEPLVEGGFVASRHTVLVVVLALALPATALSATVKVRVEGKTRTLFAPTEVSVNANTALDALEQASILGELYYHVTVTGFGPFVDQIGRYGGSASSGWAYKVDNVSPPVGADKETLKDGDHVLWYYADFGPNGGPPTLQLTASGSDCYVAQAYDDSGKATAVQNLVLHIGSKSTATAQAGKKTCVDPHRGLLVRATADGAIRSNALR